MSENFIGQSKHGGGFVKKIWLYLKSEFDKGGVKGGHNIYRVCPPLFSLAKDGKYAAYHAVHKFLVNSQGKMRMFECIEQIDYKTKLIKTHCPACDYRRTMEAKYKLIEDRIKALTDPGQITEAKERLKAFKLTNVDPYAPERRFWLNVIGQDNSIGLLSIPSKSFTALRSLLDEYSEKGYDLTGIKGMFLDFRKISQYKGDNQVQYPVDFFREVVPGGTDMTEKPKVHELTAEIITRLRTEASDLADLFKKLNSEQIDTLVNAEGPARSALVDAMFTRPETKDAAEPLKADIGGTGMTAVGRVEVGAGGVTAAMPDVTSIKPSETAPKPTQDLDTIFSGAPAATGAGTVSTAPAASTQAPPVTATPSAPATMSDDEFSKMFS